MSIFFAFRYACYLVWFIIFIFRENLVQLNVFFPENSVVKYLRDELYAPEDMIGEKKPVLIDYIHEFSDGLIWLFSLTANIGGTMGLCLGFSLVSAVEFIYFFTARLLLDEKRWKVFFVKSQKSQYLCPFLLDLLLTKMKYESPFIV